VRSSEIRRFGRLGKSIESEGQDRTLRYHHSGKNFKRLVVE
jgi:hypothetical protein